jgi:hypothetical protein
MAAASPPAGFSVTRQYSMADRSTTCHGARTLLPRRERAYLIGRAIRDRRLALGLSGKVAEHQ